MWKHAFQTKIKGHAFQIKIPSYEKETIEKGQWNNANGNGIREHP